MTCQGGDSQPGSTERGRGGGQHYRQRKPQKLTKKHRAVHISQAKAQRPRVGRGRRLKTLRALGSTLCVEELLKGEAGLLDLVSVFSNTLITK